MTNEDFKKMEHLNLVTLEEILKKLTTLKIYSLVPENKIDIEQKLGGKIDDILNEFKKLKEQYFVDTQKALPVCSECKEDENSNDGEYYYCFGVNRWCDYKISKSELNNNKRIKGV